MKNGTESTSNGGGWVLALTTMAVAVTLFIPLVPPTTPQGRMEWLAPGHISTLLALCLASGGFWAFRKRFWPRGPHESRRLRNGILMVLLQALVLRTAIELDPTVEALAGGWCAVEAWLWMPWFLVTGLTVMLLGGRIGVLIALGGALLLYVRADPGPLPLMGCLVAPLWGILLLRRSNRRRVFRAGMTVGALLGVVAVIHGLQTGIAMLSIPATLLLPVLVGLISAFAVLTFLPVIEWVLGELSDVTLAEYGSDHPLLEQLKEQAPGTWHHTLNVADLAEKAAAAIGARALFCKTAALYHDVGKLKDPSIFAENITGVSPHEQMDPRVSAGRIIEHVTYGLELARKHRLPKAFREIIAEHHGTSVVRFFLAKACEQLREGEAPETLRHLFSYPGPTPSSRESGIIALSDIVEAATRSFEAKSEEEARSFVRKLIADRVSEGELAQCPLTLAELTQVEATFFIWLKGRHHQRPAYPKAAAVPVGSGSEWSKAEKAAQPA